MKNAKSSAGITTLFMIILQFLDQHPPFEERLQEYPRLFAKISLICQAANRGVKIASYLCAHYLPFKAVFGGSDQMRCGG